LRILEMDDESVGERSCSCDARIELLLTNLHATLEGR
jgi:hypothetical protein